VSCNLDIRQFLDCENPPHSQNIAMGSFLSVLSCILGFGLSPTLDPQASLLLSIYQPDLDPKTLDPQKLRLEQSVNRMRDFENEPTVASPSYSQIEQSAVDLWRRQVGEQVETRIATYRVCEPGPVHIASEPQPRPSKSRRCPKHTVFHIAELLDLILQFAGPKAQVRALLVSTT
jgi:hypothetical protein